MSGPFIEINHLRKTFGTIVAVDDVSLQLEEGRTAAIIGSSGCGKSTFLRCLNMLETPTSGTMRIGEDEVAFANGDMVRGAERSLSFRKSMAMVFQSFELFRNMNVLRNITLAPRLVKGMRRQEAEETALALLDRVGLKHKATAPVTELSGGQAQRVAIARALAMAPRVLLFDEATSALDPELVGEVLAVIRDLASEGRTLLVVTHELAFARDVADTLYFFDKGRVLESGKPEVLMENPGTERLASFLKRYSGQR